MNLKGILPRRIHMSFSPSVNPLRCWSLVALLLLHSPTALSSELQVDDSCYRERVLDRQCLAERHQRSDSAVTNYYQDLRQKLEQAVPHSDGIAADMDESAEDGWLEQRLDMLIKSQALWLEYRDVVCDAHAHEYQFGSMAWPVKMTCLIELNEARLQQLQNIYGPKSE